MYQLFIVLKNRPFHQLITKEEIQLASGEKVLNPGKAKEYFNNLKNTSENIHAAFERQAVNAAISDLIFLFVVEKSLMIHRSLGIKKNLSSSLPNGS